MSYIPLDGGTTGATLEALAPTALKQLYQKTLDTHANNSDFFAKLEGGPNAVIQVNRDSAAQAGMTINITTRSDFFGEGKQQDELFENPSDFEQDNIYNYQLKVDFYRNAHRMNGRCEELLGMRNELKDGTAQRLGRWSGRRRTDETLARYFYDPISLNANRVFAGLKSSEDTLSSADFLGWDFIVGAKSIMTPNGGIPFKFGTTKEGSPVHRYLVVSPDPGLFLLKTDADYKDAVKEAANRGVANPLFTGEYADVDGNIICPFNALDHDGVGPVGSFLNPKAYLGVAITAGTTTFDIKGGGNPAAAAANRKFFKYFRGYGYKFVDGYTVPQGSDTRYLLIVNPLNAPTDPGKIGMYSYTTGNNGNQITIVNRLAAAASGAAVTTLGGVTWNTGVWAGKHTDVHPAGATIVQCNAKGVPIGDSLILGARSQFRGYGIHKDARSQDDIEGGFITERYITTVFGTKPRLNAQGRACGFLRLTHAVQYAGLGIPSNIA